MNRGYGPRARGVFPVACDLKPVADYGLIS
jgi:hypothetical protein